MLGGSESVATFAMPRVISTSRPYRTDIAHKVWKFDVIEGFVRKSLVQSQLEANNN